MFTGVNPHHDGDESSSNDPIITFVGHTYRYPKNSPQLSRINYAYIIDKGSKWNITLDSEQAMKPFYDKITSRMSEAGILLKPWNKVTKNESLAVITEENCDNFESAYNCMKQALYNYLDENQDKLFRHYSIPRGYIEGFRTTADGFQVLYEILTANHPALVDLVASKEDPIKPTMAAFDNNIYTFCNALKVYYDYEYKGFIH